MKRTTIIVLILVLTLCLFTGCRRMTGNETTVPTTTAMPTTTVDTTPATMPTTTMPTTTAGTAPTDTTGVVEGIIDDVTGNSGTTSTGAGRIGNGGRG